MTNALVAALTVSGIGMLMLFVAMGLLYGLMYGMTALIKDNQPSSPKRRGDTPWSPRSSPRETQIAAAIAVALARAEQEMNIADTPQVEETSCAWWRLHHQRQLTNSSWRTRGN